MSTGPALARSPAAGCRLCQRPESALRFAHLVIPLAAEGAISDAVQSVQEALGVDVETAKAMNSAAAGTPASRDNAVGGSATRGKDMPLCVTSMPFSSVLDAEVEALPSEQNLQTALQCLRVRASKPRASLRSTAALTEHALAVSSAFMGLGVSNYLCVLR